MPPISEKLLDERHEQLMEAVQGIHKRLDVLNDRTRALETKVAVLQWAYGLTGIAGITIFTYLFNIALGR